MERRRLVSPVRPGRPRSAQSHAAIVTAVIALVREVGYDALSIDAVVARAGVGKATVYRRWANKEELVAEVIESVMRATEVPDTGTTRRDLQVLIRGQMKLFNQPQSAQLLAGLVSAMHRSARIAQAVRNGFISVRRSALKQVLVRGVARGELRRGLEVDLALDLLSGAPFYRMAVTGGRLDERMVVGLVDAVLRGFAPRRKSR